MASTKARTSIWSSQVLIAGAGDTSSSWIDLSDGYGAQINLRLTNGATGPTLPAQVEVQFANDYNGGSPNLPIEATTVVGGTANNGVYEWTIGVPIAVAAVRLVGGSNTDQNVTADADISEVTAVA